MSEENIWYLEDLDVKGIFCPTKMEATMNAFPHRNYKKGDLVYHVEDKSDKIYLIIDGRVKIGTHAPTGKEITKSILSAGEVFGELAITEENKRRDFAQAMEKTTLCVLHASDIKKLLKDHSSLNIFFLNLIGSRSLEMERRLESLVFKDSRTRIIDYLVELGRNKGKRVGYETLVTRFLTHKEIASLTATSRQTVTTVLSELRNLNLIPFNRKRLLIRDLEKLAAFS